MEDSSLERGYVTFEGNSKYMMYTWNTICINPPAIGSGRGSNRRTGAIKMIISSFHGMNFRWSMMKVVT